MTKREFLRQWRSCIPAMSTADKLKRISQRCNVSPDILLQLMRECGL